MKNKKILISLATYKEAENLEILINEINNNSNFSKILIINDRSKDGTKELIENLNKKNGNIIFIEREKKLGLGTAHKLCLLYAIKFNYDFLVTMDADLSHEPSSIPFLLSKATEDNFVIGSRYCDGGKCDYTGLRKIVSMMGNYVARKLLNIDLFEITTYFRIYSVKLIKKLPYDELNAEGYSLGVKIVWLMKKLNAKLVETPIHFKHRNKGASKIPKLQIFISFFDLLILKFKDLFQHQKFYEKNETYNFKNTCTKCENSYLTSIKEKVYKCLICGYVNKV